MSGDFRPLRPAPSNTSSANTAFMQYSSVETPSRRRPSNATSSATTDASVQPHLKKRIHDDLLQKTTIRAFKLWDYDKLANYFTDHILRHYDLGATVQMSDEQLRDACDRCYIELLVSSLHNA